MIEKPQVAHNSRRNGNLCQARGKRQKKPNSRGGRVRCAEPVHTIRRIEGAPGLWIHVDLCYDHQYVWDEAGRWGGAILYREKIDSNF